MLLTTTQLVEGKSIQKYHGIVTGEAVLGANVISSFSASVQDVSGGSSAAHEKDLNRARQIALKELREQATALGANAIIGIDLDYQSFGHGMLMVSVTGTAVSLE